MGAGSRTPAFWRAQSRDAVGVHCGDPAAKVAMATVQHRVSHGIIGCPWPSIRGHPGPGIHYHTGVFFFEAFFVIFFPKIAPRT